MFPSKSSQRRLASLLATDIEVLEVRTLLSLTAVPANSAYPYTSIVEITATFPNQKTYVGSGAMVDSFHVLTAGHVIYSYSDGGWATTVTVTPELNGKSKPFGTAYATSEMTYTAWQNYSKGHAGLTAPGAYDIGLLTLDRTIGNSTGWMSFGTNTDAFFRSNPILNTAGYPATSGFSGSQMYLSSGRISGLSGDGLAITYTASSISVYGGQSGSPLFAYFPTASNKYVIYGVIDAASFATRITTNVFNDIVSWSRSSAVPRSAAALTATGSANAASVQAATATASAPPASAVRGIVGFAAAASTPQVDLGGRADMFHNLTELNGMKSRVSAPGPHRPQELSSLQDEVGSVLRSFPIIQGTLIVVAR